MMGVYVKGMEMPSIGTYEASIDVTNSNGKTVISLFVRGGDGLACCGVYEAVLVPPHGRLIDADEIFNNLERTGWYDNADRDIAEDLVLDAPTVIPASGEGEI